MNDVTINIKVLHSFVEYWIGGDMQDALVVAIMIGRSRRGDAKVTDEEATPLQSLEQIWTSATLVWGGLRLYLLATLLAPLL